MTLLICSTYKYVAAIYFGVFLSQQNSAQYNQLLGMTCSHHTSLFFHVCYVCTDGYVIYIGSAMDQHGRPFNAEFYSGYPSFYRLKSQLYIILTELLDNPVETVSKDTDVQFIKWIKKPSLEKILGEQILDYQVTWFFFFFSSQDLCCLRVPKTLPMPCQCLHPY